jgi:glycolate oxidase FAD binding subunit
MRGDHDEEAEERGPVTTAEHNQLARIVGPAHVQGEGAAREFRIEGRAPEAVAAPQSSEEVSQLLALAGEAGWAVAIWGGGTQMSLGAAPSSYRLAITTRRMNRVVDYQPDDMTVTVQAGVILENLARALGGRGQFLPLDPPLTQRATAGGTVAAAASGPLRAAYGTPRDWLIGASVVAADGRLVRPGGRVVKNVAGYDLCKLYTGSLGTLGMLAELTFKVLPRPASWAYAAVGIPDAARAEDLVARILDSDTAPAALELANGSAWEAATGASPLPDRFVLLAVLAGDKEAVAWQQASLERIAAAVGLRAHGLPALHSEAWYRAVRDHPARSGLVVRLAARSSDAAMLCATAEDLAAAQGLAADVVAHAANGTVWARVPDCRHEQVHGLVAALRKAASGLGGNAVVQRVPDGFSGEVDRWGPPPGDFYLMDGIKRALDAGGVLSPGRFVGGL